MSNQRSALLLSRTVPPAALLLYLGITTGILTTASAVHADDQLWRFQYFPADQLYPHYIANPLRSSFSFQPTAFSTSDIPQAGQQRFGLDLGGSLALARLHPAPAPGQGWELMLEVGFRGQFDIKYSEDNIGWDGHYALFLDYRPNKKLAYRLGMHHTSSHVGDEYAERTGRLRINYTRQEIRLGSTWSVTDNWQTYLEVARSYNDRNQALQRAGRIEWGLQYERPHLFTERIGGYIALDLSGYEENDWDTNTTLQLGIQWPTEKRRWRLGLEYYDGRSQLGEFFQAHEKYLSLGIWLDL